MIEHNEAGLPPVSMHGEGTVSGGGKPAKTRDERRAYHKALFLERGMTEAEADRLAEEVVARDETNIHPALELSPDEAQRHAAKEAARKPVER
jgi:hypothetical protein